MAEPGPRGRPLVERLGLFGLALVFFALFAIMAVASYASGELFLAVLGAAGALMTIWVGFLTLLRG